MFGVMVEVIVGYWIPQIGVWEGVEAVEERTSY